MEEKTPEPTPETQDPGIEQQKQEPEKPTEPPTWHFQQDGTSDGGSLQPAKRTEPIKWTASEYIHHDKTAGWYFLLAACSVLVAALVYLLTKDKLSTGIIFVVGAAFGIFAARHPRELDYEIDQSGVLIDGKLYPYANFKSFALMQEDGVESIWLMPMKRFMPIITIYFDPKDKQKITEAVGNFLPVQDHKMDPVDRLMHRVRF